MRWHIEVYAGYAADLDEPTVTLEVEKYLGDIQQRSNGKFQVRRRFKTRLGGIDAERVVARYYDSESNCGFS